MASETFGSIRISQDEYRKLRADAVRLEWYAENGQSIYWIEADGKPTWYVGWSDDTTEGEESGPTFRDAIDAAMKAHTTRTLNRRKTV